MAPYEARFAKGSRIRIAALANLAAFERDWPYHHKLQSKQLQYAGRIATVKSVGFYHGGDVLYQLEEIAGMWHESCLESA